MVFKLLPISKKFLKNIYLFFNILNIFIGKNSACKWTCTVQAHVVQALTVLLISYTTILTLQTLHTKHSFILYTDIIYTLMYIYTPVYLPTGRLPVSICWLFVWGQHFLSHLSINYKWLKGSGNIEQGATIFPKPMQPDMFSIKIVCGIWGILEGYIYPGVATYNQRYQYCLKKIVNIHT